MAMAQDPPSSTQIVEAPLPPPVDRSCFTYTPFYCEENIYLLCKQLCQCGIGAPEASDLFVVFISNADRKVPIWWQKASSWEGGLVVWDYHVVCVQKPTCDSRDAVVWDLDTTLSFPVLFQEYAKQALQLCSALKPSLQRLFRVVAASLFIKYFASDRRHMKNTDGIWSAPPPKYDCIVAEDGVEHNLEHFISMSEEDAKDDMFFLRENVGQRFGVVLTERAFQVAFNSLFAPA